MRITKKFFTDLAIWMIGFGIIVGIVFPFFIRTFGVSKEIAFSWQFIMSCITAGALVGAVNITLTRFVVISRFRILTSRMQLVKENLMRAVKGGNLEECTPEKCYIPITSNDEIGKSAQAFNSLVNALYDSISTERKVKDYTQMLTSRLELNSLTDKALFKIMEVTNSYAGAILLEHEGELVASKTINIKNPEKLIKHGTVLEVLKNAKTNITKIPAEIIIDGLLLDLRPKEIITEPLIYNNIPIGVMVLASISEFDEEKISLISIFTKSLSLALHNAIIHEQIQKLATIDPLTGLLNRRYGMIRLREEYSRAVRSESLLGVIMFDIDHFKKINDTYGHIAGDRVLIHISKLIKNLIREGDILMRFGGEEFCIILPGASRDDSFNMAERIRFAISQSSVLYADYNIKATLSLGVASYPEAGVNNEQQLLHLADEALYISKETGRNKSTVK